MGDKDGNVLPEEKQAEGVNADSSENIDGSEQFSGSSLFGEGASSTIKRERRKSDGTDEGDVRKEAEDLEVKDARIRSALVQVKTSSGLTDVEFSKRLCKKEDFLKSVRTGKDLSKYAITAECFYRLPENCFSEDSKKTLSEWVMADLVWPKKVGGMVVPKAVTEVFTRIKAQSGLSHIEFSTLLKQPTDFYDCLMIFQKLTKGAVITVENFFLTKQSWGTKEDWSVLSRWLGAEIYWPDEGNYIKRIRELSQKNVLSVARLVGYKAVVFQRAEDNMASVNDVFVKKFRSFIVKENFPNETSFREAVKLYNKLLNSVIPNMDTANKEVPPIQKPTAEKDATSTESDKKDLSNNEGGKNPNETTPPYKADRYQLRPIVVSSTPVSVEQMVLTQYYANSLTALLQIRTREGNVLTYIGDIKNNKISSGPFSEVLCIYDADEFCVYKVNLAGLEGYVSIDAYGSATSYWDEDSSKIVELTDEGIIFDGAAYQYPTTMQTTHSQFMERHGEIIHVVDKDKRYLVNNMCGTLLGFSAIVNGECITIEGRDKQFLARVSAEVLLIRDIEEGHEEYVAMKSNMIFGADDVVVIGGCLIVQPSEEKTSCSVFVPREYQFGTERTLTPKEYESFSNCVYFGKEKLLITERGDFIENVDLEQVQEGYNGVVLYGGVLYYV